MADDSENGNALPFILAIAASLVVVLGSLAVAPSLTVMLAVLLAFGNLGVIVALSRG